MSARDKRVADALRARYGDSPWLETASQFADDIGVGKRKIYIHHTPLNQKLELNGDYLDLTGETGRYIDKPEMILMPHGRAKDPDNALASVAHELMHAKDVGSGRRSYNATGVTHHADFKNFEEELPRLLDEQAFQEMLNQSSMKLQHPWRNDPPIASPWIQPKKI